VIAAILKPDVITVPFLVMMVMHALQTSATRTQVANTTSLIVMTTTPALLNLVIMILDVSTLL